MLDPLFTLTSQNQRLTENTQRTSDQLRSQALKEKEKGRRGSVDSADISSEMNQMGEDLMGSMDPDLFGKGGNAALFKKLWEETVENEEEAEEEEEQRPQGGDSHDDGQEEGENPAQEPPKPPGQLVLEGERLERPAPEAPPALPTEPPPKPASRKASEPRKAAEPRVDTRTRDSRSRQAEVRAASDQAAPPPLTIGGGSLLDFSEGFLLHESVVEVAAPEAPVVEAFEPIAPHLEALLARLLQGDATSAAWPRLQRLMTRFGPAVLTACAAQKVKMVLLPRGSGVKSHPTVKNALSGAGACGGAYLPESRTCLVEEEALMTAPRGFHPALFYFAQAWDHALGGEEFASVQSAAVKASFDACRRALPGHAFPDGMAAESTVHYFAQAVEAYLSENDCVDALWTREDLYDFDRSMYSYVEYLLKRK